MTIKFLGLASVFFIVTLPLASFAEPSSGVKNFKVGLVLDKGGKSDKGFNAAALDGAEKAKKALNIQIDVVEADGDQGHEPLLQNFAKQGYNLVLALGEARSAALKRVAAQFPKVNFGILDGQVDAPNVRSILFKEQEGSYLVGAVAALTTKTQVLGFIGGMDVPVMHRFVAGFEAGALKVNPKVKLITRYIGKTGEAWHNPKEGKKIALSIYDQGADVIFAAAGGSNLGIFDATEEKKKLAIGVSNQNWIKPGFILTSMRKRVDVVVLMTCQDALYGGFSGEVKRYGLANQALDYVIDSNNEKLIHSSLISRVKVLENEIIEEKIKVPDPH